MASAQHLHQQTVLPFLQMQPHVVVVAAEANAAVLSKHLLPIQPCHHALPDTRIPSADPPVPAAPAKHDHDMCRLDRGDRAAEIHDPPARGLAEDGPFSPTGGQELGPPGFILVQVCLHALGQGDMLGRDGLEARLDAAPVGGHPQHHQHRVLAGGQFQHLLVLHGRVGHHHLDARGRGEARAHSHVGLLGHIEDVVGQ